MWDACLIVAFTAWGPAMTFVNNRESPGILTPLVLVTALVLVGLGLRSLMIKFGLDGRGSTYALSIFAVAALNLGSLVATFPLGRFGLVVLSLLAATVIYGVRDLRMVELAMTWGCLALALAPIATAVTKLELGQGREVSIGEDLLVPPFTNRPDVVVVVADGYASNEALDVLYEYDNSDFADSLAEAGTNLIEGVDSNYARTKLSIPSMLEMDYVPVGIPVTNAFEGQLMSVLGGENRLADVMHQNGYRTIYAESGWFGTRCAPAVDVCIGSVWPDETLYDVLHRSILRDLPGFETGMSFARGAQHSLLTLRPTLEAHLGDEQPDLIYFHVLAPHPPLFLDGACQLRPEPALSGFTMGQRGLSEANLEARRNAYVEQIACVNRHLVEAAEMIDIAGAVGLFLGDHGSDLGEQLSTHSDMWSDADRAERFGVLFAVHHNGCDYGGVSTLVNVGRRLIGCLSGEEVTMLPNRYFDLDKRGNKTPVVVELEPPGPLDES